MIVNTIAKNQSDRGRVYALKGDGSHLPGWPQQPEVPLTCTTNQTVDTGASPVISDLDGDGMSEVLLVSNWEIVVWRASGVQISRDGACPDPPEDLVLATANSLSSSPAVADLDRDGDVEVVIGGASQGGWPGALYVWDFPGESGEIDVAWPEHRKDRENRALFRVTVFADGFETGDPGRWSGTQAY